jgi:flagellar FliL protein
MATAAAAAPADAATPEGGGKGAKKKLLLLAVPVVLVLVGAGLWFGGILPPLLGMGKAAEHGEADAKPADAHGAKPADAHGAKPADPHGAKPAADAHGAKPAAKPSDASADTGATFIDLPDIISNLNTGGRRAVYIKLKSRIELAKPSDEAILKAALPRVLDLFQTYLREMRPEEMRGSAGTYRLREELIARANIAVAPARIQDLLFTEILIQ